ncbi:hypothetical protein GTY20_02115 [Streptomyces sp. SID4946]|uniref:hypothetical protein n=1 Tax=Streptomyces sp. LamerLS-31b TaxID=1839765 RepID=UPI00081F5387|nr:MULTISPECIES: hypothetical protein [unclassified Streptomyces]MYQ90220.1 hypothetical protein [Streptomyces sp. SID4946]SCF57876.1 hypothetical protein GA0115258_10097 [Streptomyces sp. LamerLS-31b]SCF59063.1 hypothetical protein GA0115256_103510 [Streptomyces sp. DconLS]
MKLDANRPWQEQAFGEHVQAVRHGLGQALRNMHENARNAQEEARVEDKDPYGSSRYTGQFRRIEEELGGIAGALPVRPHGFRFNLMLVGRGLIYPFRYAKKNADVRLAHVPHSQLIRELLTNFGTEPEHEQGVLNFAADTHSASSPLELRAGLRGLPAGTMLILTPFACNAEGLLECYWGVASLGDSGTAVQWASQPETLPVPDTPTTKHGHISLPHQTAPAGELGRFDHGTLPEVSLVSRPKADTKRRVTPLTEAKPIRPQASEENE